MHCQCGFFGLNLHCIFLTKTYFHLEYNKFQHFLFQTTISNRFIFITNMLHALFAINYFNGENGVAQWWYGLRSGGIGPRGDPNFLGTKSFFFHHRTIFTNWTFLKYQQTPGFEGKFLTLFFFGQGGFLDNEGGFSQTGS